MMNQRPAKAKNLFKSLFGPVLLVLSTIFVCLLLIEIPKPAPLREQKSEMNVKDEVPVAPKSPITPDSSKSKISEFSSPNPQSIQPPGREQEDFQTAFNANSDEHHSSTSSDEDYYYFKMETNSSY